MPENFEYILNFLHDTHGYDFSQSRHASLKRKINQRLSFLKINSATAYIQYLESHLDEWPILTDLLTINISRFFRNPLTFETINKKLIPNLVERKIGEKNSSIRVWSVGCASGEEAFSIAILLKEIVQKKSPDMVIHIFATDINTNILKKAKQGWFGQEQLYNVRLGLLKKYFVQRQDGYKICDDILNMVSFSFYDILDNKTRVPPESVFGDFDLVLCRNLLIYFKPESQAVIFNKLYHALAPEGFLVLGRSERLPVEYEKKMTIQDSPCRIYYKTARV